MMDFTGRRLLVLGGTGGIGRAVAVQVLERGGAVFFTGRTREGVSATRAELAALSAEDRLAGMVIDLADKSDVGRLRAALLEQRSVVDLLVNTAAVADPLEGIPSEAAGSLDGAFLAVAQVVADRLIDRQRPGAIVNIASTAPGGAAVSNLCTDHRKAELGLPALTQHLAIELAVHRIRVNAVTCGVARPEVDRHVGSTAGAPPVTLHDDLDLRTGRTRTAEDVAQLAVFLLSDAAAWVTGAVLDVDQQAMADST